MQQKLLQLLCNNIALLFQTEVKQEFPNTSWQNWPGMLFKGNIIWRQVTSSERAREKTLYSNLSAQ